MHIGVRRRFWLVWLAVLGVFALVAVACGNDDDDAPAPSADGGAEEPSGDGAEEPSDDDEMSEAEAAAARIAPLFELPQSIHATEPLASLPTGASVALIGLAGLANEDASGREFLAAAELLGLEVTEFSGGFDPASQIAVLEEVATQNFDVAVVQSFTEAAATSPAMAALKDSGTRVIAYGTSIPGRSNDFMDHQFLAEADSKALGSVMADWIVADSDGTANVLAMYPPDFAAARAILAGFEDQIGAICPGCEVVPFPFSAADIAAALPGQVVSALQANPDVDYLIGGFGQALIGIPEALDEAGLSDQVLTVSYYGVGFNQALIAGGVEQVMALNTSQPFRGYLLADAVARVLTGQQIEDWSDTFYEPLQFIDASNIIETDVDCICMADDFREQFHALWGVGDAPGPMSEAEAAAARIAPLFELPQSIHATEPLASLPTGASVALIGLAGLANEDASGREFLAAAELLGLEVTEFSGGFDPASQIAVLEEVATQNFDVAVVQSFTEAAATSPAMAALKDSGTRVIAYGTSIPGRSNDFMDHQFLAEADSKALGSVMADWIVADSDGTANVLAMYPPDFAAARAILAGFEDQIGAICPGCEVVPFPFSAADIAAALPGQVVSALQANPDVDYLIGGFGQALIGIPEALDEAGLSDQVLTVSYYGVGFNQALIAGGVEQVMALNTSQPFRGYLLADAVARVLTGQQIEDWSDTFYEPLQFIDASNIIETDVDCICMADDFREQFHALWGVG